MLVHVVRRIATQQHVVGRDDRVPAQDSRPLLITRGELGLVKVQVGGLEHELVARQALHKVCDLGMLCRVCQRAVVADLQARAQAQAQAQAQARAQAQAQAQATHTTMRDDTAA